MHTDHFLSMRNADLHRTLVNGHPIDPRQLDDTEYKGISLGLPGFVDKLAWKTFKKVFHRDPASGHLRGWNVRIRQTGVTGPFEYQTKDGVPVTWGHYRVVPNRGRGGPKPCDQGLLIDYSLGGNGRLGMVPMLRDPLVAVEDGSAELLLGWSYVQLGPVAIPTPSYFLLVRDGALTHMANPPVETNR